MLRHFFINRRGRYSNHLRQRYRLCEHYEASNYSVLISFPLHLHLYHKPQTPFNTHISPPSPLTHTKNALILIIRRVAIAHDRLLPGHQLEWDAPGKWCQLIGFAANKLWFQWLTSGDIFGCTEDMLRQAVGRGVLETIRGSPVGASQV